MTSSCRGIIREEHCSCHEQVEWVVDYASLPEYDILNSPTFNIGVQKCVFQLKLTENTKFCQLDLLHTDLFANNRVLCFLGLKSRDGSYHYQITADEIDQKTSIVFTHIIERHILEKLCWDLEKYITFFVRMIRYCTQKERETCTQGVSQLTPSNKGCIREEKCSDNSHVEWDLEYELLKQCYYTATSPVFDFGGQRYLIELRYVYGRVRLCLFRMGRTSKADVRHFLGARNGDGSYDHRIEREVFDMKKGCEVWMEVPKPKFFLKFELEKLNLSPDQILTFFVRLQFDGTSYGPETCSHGIGIKPSRGVGSVKELDFVTYKQMDWKVNWGPPSRNVTSPSFSLEDQNYLWELSCDECDCPLLQLFRMGPSVNKSVRWWSYVKRTDEFHQEYGNEYAEMFLKHNDYTMWQPVGFPLPLEERLFGEEPLIVSFLMAPQQTLTRH